MKNTWFHGTVYDFEQFDSNELGKSSNSRDAELGFYFGKNKRTAEAYIESGQSINEENFKEKYKLSIEEIKSKILKLENNFESKYNISYNEAKNSYSKQFKLKREFEDFRSDFDTLNNHYNVIDPYSYEEESPIVDYYLLGNIFEIETEEDNFFYYDMENQPWDENKQTQLTRQFPVVKQYLGNVEDREAVFRVYEKVKPDSRAPERIYLGKRRCAEAGASGTH